MASVTVDAAIIGVSAFLIVVFVVVFCCWRRWKKKRESGKPVYTIRDNYSVLASEIRFDDKDKSKKWYGGSGDLLKIKEQETLREKREKELYNSAKRTASNFCRLVSHKRQIRDSLACINSRNNLKYFYPVDDSKLSKMINNNTILMIQYDITKLPILNDKILGKNKSDGGLGDYRIIDFNSSSHFTAFKLALETLRHDYIDNILDIGLSKDKKSLYIFREFNIQGSLRDHIYKTNLSKSYHSKYNKPGTGLGMNTVRRFGRQILEGMNYISQCGLVNYHLHSGNIILYNANKYNQYNNVNINTYLTPKISEIENNFLSLKIKHPYDKYIKKLKKIYNDLNVELCLFGYLLFEMATGRESPSSSPLDCLHELPFKLPSSFVNVLGKIFGDRSLGAATRISDLLNDPYFSAKNVPPLNTFAFHNIRKENELLESIRNAIVLQCFETYNYDNKTTLTQYNKPKTLKRKKRRKKGKKKSKKNKVRSNDTTSNENEREISVSVSVSEFDENLNDSIDVKVFRDTQNKEEKNNNETILTTNKINIDENSSNKIESLTRESISDDDNTSSSSSIDEDEANYFP